MAAYYQKISEYILPYLRDRPLVLHRYPEGVGGIDFYQKETPDYFPEWIDRIRVELKEARERDQELVNCNGLDTLLYLVNQGVITPHVWLSTKDHLDRPDRMIFDLDPPEGEFDIVRRGAWDLNALLHELGLKAYIMSTGSKGFHILVPLDGEASFDESRECASRIAKYLAGQFPDRYTTETRKDQRGGRLFLDYLRNSYGQTGVAPYSLRGRKGAPVATPLDWKEIGESDITPTSYTYENIFRRLGQKEDPWRDINRHKTGLKRALKQIKQL